MYQAGISSCPDSSDLHNNYGVFLVDTGEWTWGAHSAPNQAPRWQEAWCQLHCTCPPPLQLVPSPQRHLSGLWSVIAWGSARASV